MISLSKNLKNIAALFIFQIKNFSVHSLSKIVISILLLSQSISFSQNKNLEKVKLQLKWYHQFQFAGYYTAKLKGFYEENGLDVELIEGNKDNQPIKSVLTKKADFGISDATVIQKKMSGIPLVLVSSVFQHSPHVLISLKEKNIKTPFDLSGKKIMLSDDQGGAQIKAVILKEGINIDSIEFIPHSYSLDEFLQNKVDAISVYLTSDVVNLKLKGIEVNVINPVDYGIDFYGDAIFTAESQAKENRDRIKKFKAASSRGWKYALTHQDEIIDYILNLESVKQRKITKEQLKLEAEQISKLIDANTVEIGHINFNRVENIAKIFADLKLAPSNYSLEGFYFSEDEKSNEKALRLVIIILTVVSVIIIITFIWISQLKRIVNKKTRELKDSSDKLFKSEELFRAIAETAEDIIEVLDLNGLRLYVSPSLNNLLETKDNLIGTYSFQEIHADDQEKAKNVIKEILITGKSQRCEYRIITSSLKIKYVEAQASLVLTKENKPERLVVVIRDISDRKNQEQTIIASEQRFRSVWDNSTVGMRITDENGIIIDVNNAYCDLVLLTREELIGQFFNVVYKLSDEKNNLKALESYRKRFSQGEVPEKVETKIVLKNYKEMTVEFFNRFFSDVAGKKYLVSVFLDITERKRAEIKFKKIFEEANDAIFIMDEDIFIDCNPATERIFNVTREQILQRKPYDFSPEFQNDGRLSKEKALEKINLALNGEPQLFEWVHKKFDGVLFDAEVTLNKIEIEGKQMLQAIVRDISERKQVEKIQSTLLAISEATKSSENLDILYLKIHESVKKLMNADNFYIALYDDLTNLISFPYFVDEEDTTPKPRIPKKGLTEYVLRSGIPTLATPEIIKLLEDNGDIERIGSLSLDWLGVPLSIKNKCFGVIVVQTYKQSTRYTEIEKNILTFVSSEIAMAIQSKKADEEIRKTTEKLKELNVSKDKFFSILAHDLRSPFHGLMGYSQILYEDYESFTDEERKNFINTIHYSLRNLFKLIENLLEWSRVQTGNIQFQPIKVNANEAVQNSINVLISNAIRKKIQIENLVPSNIYVKADSKMLQSVLDNLISNSIKFTNQNGEISIRSRENENYIEFTVEDTGVGMTKEDIQKIFRIDSHHSTKGTDEEKGTGLGLILCKEFIEKNNGKISVESIKGKGSKFIFSLPKF